MFIGAVPTSGFRAGWQEEFEKNPVRRGFWGWIERSAVTSRRYVALLEHPLSQPGDGWNGVTIPVAYHPRLGSPSLVLPRPNLLVGHGRVSEDDEDE